jgi:hypothetical protein
MKGKNKGGWENVEVTGGNFLPSASSIIQNVRKKVVLMNDLDCHRAKKLGKLI